MEGAPFYAFIEPRQCEATTNMNCSLPQFMEIDKGELASRRVSTAPIFPSDTRGAAVFRWLPLVKMCFEPYHFLARIRAVWRQPSLIVSSRMTATSLEGVGGSDWS